MNVHRRKWIYLDFLRWEHVGLVQGIVISPMWAAVALYFIIYVTVML